MVKMHSNFFVMNGFSSSFYIHQRTQSTFSRYSARTIKMAADPFCRQPLAFQL